MEIPEINYVKLVTTSNLQPFLPKIHQTLQPSCKRTTSKDPVTSPKLIDMESHSFNQPNNSKAKNDDDSDPLLGDDDGEWERPKIPRTAYLYVITSSPIESHISPAVYLKYLPAYRAPASKTPQIQLTPATSSGSVMNSRA